METVNPELPFWANSEKRKLSFAELQELCLPPIRCGIKSEFCEDQQSLVTFSSLLSLPFLPSRSVADELRKQLSKMQERSVVRLESLGTFSQTTLSHICTLHDFFDDIRLINKAITWYSSRLVLLLYVKP